ncbi:MAG: SBBP repeat-containing protein [Candidatus Omnitrophota bacterium]
MKNKIIFILIYLFSFHSVSLLYALPQGWNIEEGSATFQQDQTTLNITADDKTVINFNSFDIQTNETVNFIQPSQDATLLSRILDSDPTNIYGSLNANGILFLTNPNGINFHDTASVNAGSLVASTLDISTNNFIEANYIFDQEKSVAPALIKNQGRIETESNAALLAGAVDNSGIITAKLGVVTLSCGVRVTVSIDAQALMSVEVNEEVTEKIIDSEGNTVKDQIKNSGELVGHQVFMSAKTADDIFEYAVNNTGIVKATKLVEEDGVIKLVANQDIQASGEFSGDTTIASDKDIHINDDLTVDSGDLNILADNDLNGEGSIQQAPNATIKTTTYGDITLQSSGESHIANIVSAGDITFKPAGAPAVYNQYPNSAIITQGSLTIDYGVTINANNAIYEVSKDLNGFGNFIPQSSNFFFISAKPTIIKGSNTFNNLTIQEPNKEVKFDPDTTQTIKGILTLKGKYAELLKLKSLIPGKQYSIIPEGETDIAYILIQDCYNARAPGIDNRAPPIKAIHSDSLGNNTNWDLDPIWTGQGQTQNWSDPNNWDTGTIPTQYSIVTFNGNTSQYPQTNKDSIIDATFQGTVAQFTIDGYTGTITLRRSLTISGDLTIKGESYTSFGSSADLASKVFLKGDLILQNPNSWIYADISLAGEGNQRIDYSAGTIYGNIDVDKPSGEVSYGELNLGSIPLYFIANQGQISDSQVKFYIYFKESRIYFTNQFILYSLSQQNSVESYNILNIRLSFLGASSSSSITPGLSTNTIFNYLIGNDSSQHQTNIASYYKIIYQGLYEGVDLSYSSKNGNLESEFVVASGADYANIKLGYEGVNSLIIDESGNLIIDTEFGQLKEAKPYAYQNIAGIKQEVSAGFILLSDNSYGFSVNNYDTNYPLVIDPTLGYSTFIGGSYSSAQDEVYALAIDSAGNAYISGYAHSYDYPTTSGAYDTFGYGDTAVVTKFSADASSLSYSTFIGGRGQLGTVGDYGRAIVVDSSGNAYITGYTADTETDYPTTGGAYDTTHNGGEDVFVTKFNSTGTALTYSTLIGGSGNDYGRGIAIDAAGNAYVTGYTGSTNFPTLNPYQANNGGGYDVFVTKFNSTGTALTYSTFIGGSGDDYGYGIVIDSPGGNAYITGYTADAATDYPTTVGAYDRTHNGGNDVFVTKLNSTGTALTYSTLLGGGNGDYGFAMRVDSSGNIYITGYTSSSDYPTTAGAYDQTHNNFHDAFVTKLNATGTAIIYSTFIGGSYTDRGRGIAIDSSGNAYITGDTFSDDFPTTSGAYDPTVNGWIDVFVTKLNSTGTALVYSTYIGGSGGTDRGYAIAVDTSGCAYITGYGTGGYPTTAGAYDTVYNGSVDAFITKLNAAGSALTYSTYLGGSGQDYGLAIAVDSSGCAYITGRTADAATDYPITGGAYDQWQNGNVDAFVTKINSTGTTLVYSTFLGGGGDDYGYAIAIDSSGNAYITGYTADAGIDYPTTGGAYDEIHNGSNDVFVTKLNSTGTALTYSTFIGGSGADYGYAIAIDSSGNAYITGYTADAGIDYPTTGGAYDTTHNGVDDAFLSELSSTGASLTYSTFLGGSDNDYGRGIAIDSAGNVYITGYTYNAATNYPTTAGAYDETQNGNYDVFVTKFNPTISGTIYTDEAKSATVGADVTVGLSVNGAAKTTAVTNSDGKFFWFYASINADDTILLFIDDSGSYEANLISQALSASTAASITGLEMYTSKIVLRHESAGPLTNNLLATADNSGDDDIHYTFPGGLLTFDTGYEVWIDSGKTYTPGAAVSLDSIENNGTFNTEANAVTVRGSWDNADGSFTSSGTVTFTTASAATINSGGTGDSRDFQNIEINKAGGSLQLSGNALEIDAGLTITAGTLDLNGQSVTNSNSLSITNNGTLKLVGSENIPWDSNDIDSGIWEYKGAGSGPYVIKDFGASDYYHLTINAANATDEFRLGNALAIDGTLTITAGVLSLRGNSISDIAGGDAATRGNIAGTLRLQGPETVFWLTNDVDSGTWEYVGAGLGPYEIKDFGGDDYYSLTINAANGSDVFLLSAGLNVDGNLTIESGELDVNVAAHQINVAGSWENNDAFNARQGSVILDGNNQAIYGSTIFYTLNKTVITARALTFDHLGEQTINNTLTLQGDVGQLLSLRSDSPGTRAGLTLQPGKTQTLANLDVQDSDASAGDTLVADATITNSGNNLNWSFSVNISGNAYQTDESTALINGKTVTLKIYDNLGNCMETASTTTGGDNGGFSFNGKTVISGGAFLFYIDGTSETGNTFATTNGTNITTMKIYDDHLVIRSDAANTDPITNIILDYYDNDQDPANMVFDSDGGILTMENSNELYIASSGYFTPGGNVNPGTKPAGQDSVDLHGTLTIGTETFNADDTFDGTGGTIAFTGEGNLVLSSTVTAVASSLTTTMGKVTYDSTAAQTVDTGITYHDLTIDNSNSAVATQEAGTLDINGDFLINDASASFTAANAGQIEVAGNWTNNGTFTHNNGTVTFNGTAGTQSVNSGSNNFYSLKINNSGVSVQLSSALTQSAGGTLTMQAGTLDLNTRTLTLGADVSTTVGIIAIGTGTLTGSAGSYDLTVGTGGSITQGTGTLSIQDLSITGTGTYTCSGNAVINIAGHASIASSNWSASTSTITMSGTEKGLYAQDRTLNNLTITGSKVSIHSDMTISGTLNVNASKTLYIGNEKTVTFATSSAVVLGGTIEGTKAWLVFVDAAGANLATGGTLRSNVRFETQNSNLVVPNRTYDGEVELYSNSATTHTAVLGTAPGQTITCNGNFAVKANAAGDLIVDADSNDPTMDIEGGLVFIGSGAGTERLSLGSGSWSVSAGMDFSNGEVTSAGSTLICDANYSNFTSIGAAGGLNYGFVYILIVYNGSLYAGGEFTDAGGDTNADRVAKWNGTAWVSLNGSGTGLNGTVRTFYSYNGDLLIGGAFTDAGGDTNADYIAKWNGTTWVSLNGAGSGLGSTVYCMLSYGGNLIAGGYFINAGGDANADKIAKWNGSVWSSLGGVGSGFGETSIYVYAFIEYGGNLIAGGSFTDAGTDPNADRIAKWNGAAWSSLNGVNTGLTGEVRVLTLSGSDLLAGGAFTDAGTDVNADRIAKWNGTTWSSLGGANSGLTGTVYSLTTYNSNLIAAGNFTNAGTDAEADYIAKWNGSSWSSMGGVGSGFNFLAYAVTVLGTDLIAGGEFTNAGNDSEADKIAKWNGANWSSMGGAGTGLTTGQVYCMAIYNGTLIAGGYFYDAGGDSNADYIAKWNGSSWSSLNGANTGLSTTVWALAVYNGYLIAAGGFANAGDADGDYIAKWNGTAWSSMGGAGTGLNNTTYSLILYNSYLVAGGAFTDAGTDTNADRIAKWNGSSWSSLNGANTGLSAIAYSLAIYNGNLIAGGDFADAGTDTNADRIAKFNGTAWSSLNGANTGLSSTVYALTIYNGNLVAGGAFTDAGTDTSADRIAKWNGTAWSSLGGSGTGLSSTVRSLAVYNGYLIAGGAFVDAGTDINADCIAKWNGSSWSSLNGTGTGLSSTVYVLMLYNGSLFAGGDFSNAGSAAEGDRIAKFNLTTIKTNGQVLNNLTLNSSGTVTFTLQDALDIDGIFLNSDGTFDSNNKDMKFSGVWSNTGDAIFTRGNGTLTFDGTSTVTNSSSNAASLGAVTIPNAVTLGSDITMTSNTGAGSLNLGVGGYDLTLTGTGSPLGVATFNKGTNSTVTYTGTGANTNITTVAYNNLTLTPTAATNYLLTGDLTGANSLSGNLTINANATLDTTAAFDYDITLAGDWVKNGNFIVNQSAVTFNDNSQPSTISGDTTFYDFDCETAGKTLTFTAGTEQTVTSDLTIIGNLTNAITINDTGAGATPKLSLQAGATQDIENVDVTNNDASGGQTLIVEGASTLNGITTNWQLPSIPSDEIILSSEDVAVLSQGEIGLYSNYFMLHPGVMLTISELRLQDILAEEWFLRKDLDNIKNPEPLIELRYPFVNWGNAKVLFQQPQ